MLVSDVLHVKAAAEDDFGVRSLGLTWKAASDAGELSLSTTDTKFEMATAQEKKAERIFAWSPSFYQIPVDSTVEIQSFAVDYLPGRQRSRSATSTLRVLSPEEHAELVRRQIDALLAQLEDVTRLQDKIVSDLHDAEKAVAQSNGAPQSGNLEQSQQDQQRNAQQLADLARQGQETAREAMKNPLVPADSIEKLTDTLRQWSQLSQDKMPEAARSMQAAAQSARNQEQQSSPSSPSSSSPSSSSPQSSQSQQQASNQTRQDTEQARQQAEAIQQALQQSQQQASQNADQLQALTLAERLRKVGKEETSLSGQLTTNFADTIGMTARELPEQFKRINTGFVNEQQTARDESATLQGEISRFFERTQKTNYGRVNQEMKETQATNELDRMGGLIQQNITVQASADLTNWAGRFYGWADVLQASADSGGGQGGQGGGQSQDLTKQLIALLRLRQDEVNLRDQTRMLEEGKAAAPNYREQAFTLASSQIKLVDSLNGIHQSIPMAQFDPPFSDAADSIVEAFSLLSWPQTDSETDAAEGKSVDRISDLINLLNEKSQQSSSGRQPGQGQEQGNSAEEMAFLTALMQNRDPSQSRPMPSMGGGNFSGGTTNRVGAPVTGNTGAGAAAAARACSKAAAGAPENYPVEFRDALQNYFHAVENSGGPGNSGN